MTLLHDRFYVPYLILCRLVPMTHRQRDEMPNLLRTELNERLGFLKQLSYFVEEFENNRHGCQRQLLNHVFIPIALKLLDLFPLLRKVLDDKLNIFHCYQAFLFVVLKLVVLPVLQIIGPVRQQVIDKKTQVIQVERFVWRNYIAKSKDTRLQIINHDNAGVHTLIDHFILFMVLH